MRFVVALPLLIATSGCDMLFEKKEPPPEPPITGTLRLTYDNDPPITLTHALAVAHGGKSFRLYLTNKPLSCEWAKGETWRYRKQEAAARFTVAPVLQPDGSTRWEFGEGWWGNEYISTPDAAYHRGSILPLMHWPIDVTVNDAGCPTKVRFDGQRRGEWNNDKVTLALEGEVVPVCCPLKLEAGAPEGPAGIAIKIGGDVYPINHADWVGWNYTTNEELYRLRRWDPPCARSIWYDDVVLDVYVHRETQKKRVEMRGRSYWASPKSAGLSVVGGSISAARVKDGNHLEVHGAFDVAHAMADSATFHVDVDGVVPITAGCGE